MTKEEFRRNTLLADKTLNPIMLNEIYDRIAK